MGVSFTHKHPQISSHILLTDIRKEEKSQPNNSRLHLLDMKECSELIPSGDRGSLTWIVFVSSLRVTPSLQSIKKCGCKQCWSTAPSHLHTVAVTDGWSSNKEVKKIDIIVYSCMFSSLWEGMLVHSCS